jgi:hypothetical protein
MIRITAGINNHVSQYTKNCFKTRKKMPAENTNKGNKE